MLSIKVTYLYTNIRLLTVLKSWTFLFKITFKFKFFLKTFFFKKKKFKSWKTFFTKTTIEHQWFVIELLFQKKNFFLFLKRKQSSFFLKTFHDEKLLIARTQFTSLKKEKIFVTSKTHKQTHAQLRTNRLTSVSSIRNFKKLYTSLKDSRSLFLKTFRAETLKRNKQTSKLLKFLVTKQTNNLLIQLELSLKSILLKSKLVSSVTQLLELINCNCVLINSKPINQITTFVPVGSKIQLILFKSYSMYYLYSYNLNLKWVYRTGYCLWRFYRHKFNLFKQSPKKLPKWLNRLMFYKQELPNYVEVDFTVLTVCVVNNPIQYDRFLSKIYNTNFFRLLNWKYVV